jgi:3-hydroxyisobutyrate dehydrogenase
MRIGFIGLGVMGEPMARNLARAGHELVVWNRTPDKSEPIRTLGAIIAQEPAHVFEQSPAVILMLFDEAAMEHVLQRGTPQFGQMVRGRTMINMSSVAPEYSQALARDVADAGGRFVEAPVSGSRVPAEKGELVAMLGGDEAICDEVRPLLAPLCREIVYCGPTGSALLMKFAVNIFMLSTAVGLAEAVHFGDRHGLDRARLQAVLDAGPMASQLSRIKMAKLIAGDFSTQGAVRDGKNNTALITAAAAKANVAAALITACRDLYKEAVDLGHGAEDMIAVIRAMEARSNALDSR